MLLAHNWQQNITEAGTQQQLILCAV